VAVNISRRAFALAVARAAEKLGKECNLKMHGKVLFHMPTCIEQMVYIQACARLGAIYCCTAIDTSADGLIHRYDDIQPDVVLISEQPAKFGGASSMQNSIWMGLCPRSCCTESLL